MTDDFCWPILLTDEIGQLYRSSDVRFTDSQCGNDLKQTECSPAVELDPQMFWGQADDLGQRG